jgi:hypothetical protein
MVEEYFGSREEERQSVLSQPTIEPTRQVKGLLRKAARMMGIRVRVREKSMLNKPGRSGWLRAGNEIKLFGFWR